MANMRSIHVSLSAYIHSQGHWPQPPEELVDMVDDGPLEDWWLDCLSEYGVEQRVWECPAVKSLIAKNAGEKFAKLHYVPTPFDEKPFTPYRWNQPWLTEIGNMHGRGAHIIFPDGSIRVMDDIVKFPD